MRLDRLLAIINLLLNRKKMPASSLARYFEVAVRTIYRDIESINAAGIPVVSYPGHNGGFGIMENYQLDRQVFTFKDMVSTLSVLQGVNRALGDKKIDAAIEKIKSLVPPAQKSRLLFQTEQMALDILPWGTGPGHQAKLTRIQQAISENRLLRCLYVNSSGARQSRVIEPMTIVFKGASWYLFGYCRLRRAFRIFRVTRMLKLTMTDKTFRRRPASYQNYLEPQNGAVPMIRLRLRFLSEMKYRLADYMDAELIQVQNDSSSIVEFSLPETEWIYGFLLGFGDKAEVLAPERIRAALAGRLKNILACYNPDIGLSQPCAKIGVKLKNKREAKKC